MAMLTGLQARATVSRDALLADLMQEHLTNGVAVTMATCVAAVVAMMEWRGWISRRIFWLRAALITWAAIGTVFSAHVGAQMVFLYGAGGGGHVGEGAIAIVVVKRAATVSRDEQVFESIVVVVADRDPSGIADAGEAGFLGNVFKGAIRLLVIKAVPIFGVILLWNCAFWGRIVDPRSVGEEDVESAVVVVIE